jgi:hypothetical protein
MFLGKQPAVHSGYSLSLRNFSLAPCAFQNSVPNPESNENRELILEIDF